MNDHPALTYRAAGVDVAAGEDFVERIAKSLHSTHLAHPESILDEKSDFAGLFRLGGDFRDPVLVSGADGVGTKLKVVQSLGRHGSVGIDLVAMCMNDVLTTGAVPLFFLDYIATGKLDPDVMSSVVEGIAEGCRRAGCALLGGETAEMPDFYGPGVYDLAGFGVGAVEREDIFEAARVREGDWLVGLPSSGLHSNGYSLVRRVLGDQSEWKKSRRLPELGAALGDALLEPTKIYSEAAAVLRGRSQVHAIAHITGGGIPGNVARILPSGHQARLRPGSWSEPGIFEFIARRGPVARAEMFRTFNMGLGLVIAVDSAAGDEVMSALSAVGEAPCRAGEICARKADEPAVVIEGVKL
ncbi:phosphoribosylformylglycinamidine cyclo-ligase [Nitrospinota bacterium]